MESNNNYLEKPVERKSSRLLQDVENFDNKSFLKDFKSFFTLFLLKFVSDRPNLLSVAVAQVSGINTKNINTVEASERKTKYRLHIKLPKWASKINSGHWSDFPKIGFLASFFEDFIVFAVFPSTIS
jgi:hypothetical protein